MTRPATPTAEPPRLGATSADDWPRCVNYPRVHCLCRGAMRNGGSTCIRRREIERAKADREPGDR